MFFKIKSKTLVFTYNRYFKYLYIPPFRFCIFIHFPASTRYRYVR